MNRKLNILQVIHGYPLMYNAGSEVYTQTLSLELVRQGHEVAVFTREENPFEKDFKVRVEKDHLNPDIKLYIVNNSVAKDRYEQVNIDLAFEKVLLSVQPDVVHINHLNHLSTGIVRVAKRHGYPVVYTLHDFWLMCPRGQFIRMQPDESGVFPLCNGQEDRKCAVNCYSRYFSGMTHEIEQDIDYWTDWVRRRMQTIRHITGLVDIFIAPSRYLLNRYARDFFGSDEKLRYIDYGFSHKRLKGRNRVKEDRFIFGYIGTHIPAKGVDLLIQAFARLKGRPLLRIYGRVRSPYTQYLKRIESGLPDDVRRRIQWMGEYKNENIVEDVFNHVDAIVVPSIWTENSPLVIHEAQQARVPVITANAGGMAEYVHHEVNGLLFKHRDVNDLARQMQRMIDEEGLAQRLGSRGYLYSKNGDVVSIEEHVEAMMQVYEEAISMNNKRSSKIKGPWRVTFDTNPDQCNLHCIMCEEHALESPKFQARKKLHLPPRIMDFKLIQQVVEDLAGHGLREIIPSTMGEPLMYPDFEKIIELCQKYDIKLNLTTNGTFYKYGAEYWARLLMPVLSDIKISFNGATPAVQEAIMRGSRFDKTLSNIKTFLRIRDEHRMAGGNNVSVTLQPTFMEANLKDLPEIVRMACELGIDRVKGHHVWVNFPALKEQSLKRSPEAIFRWNETLEQILEIVKKCNKTRYYKLRLDNFYPLKPDKGEEVPWDWECPFLGKEAWVHPGGEFYPCCAPDDQRRKLGDFGLVTDGFFRIWNSKEYKWLGEHYKEFDVCRHCNMRRPKEVKDEA